MSFVPYLFVLTTTLLVSNHSYARGKSHLECSWPSIFKIRCTIVYDDPRKKIDHLYFSSCEEALKSPLLSAQNKIEIKGSKNCLNPPKPVNKKSSKDQ